MPSILIIGGGVIGLALAREFRKKGIRKITILERGEIGKEASFAAAGMLAPQAEADQADDFFEFCDDSRRLYKDFTEELLEETGIDVELDMSGTLYTALTEHDLEEIQKRFSWQTSAGLKVERLTAKETQKLEPFISPDSLESLFFPNDWHVETRKLIKALRTYAELNEIEIIEYEHVTNLFSKSGKIIGAETSSGKKFFADIFLLTVGAWTSSLKLDQNSIPLPKIKPIKGQMMSFCTAKRLINHVVYSPRGYIVPRKTGKLLAGATVEDVGFENDITESATELIRQNALEIAPIISNLTIDDEWAGLRPCSPDGLPVIGGLSEDNNLFVATAHYRNGILLAPMTARILVDKIAMGKNSKYLYTFNPNRFKVVRAHS